MGKLKNKRKRLTNAIFNRKREEAIEKGIKDGAIVYAPYIMVTTGTIVNGVETPVESKFAKANVNPKFYGKIEKRKKAHKGSRKPKKQ